MLTAIIVLIIVVLVFLLAGIRIVPQGMTMVIGCKKQQKKNYPLDRPQGTGI